MYGAIIFDCFGVLTTDTWKEFVESQPPNIDRERLRELNRQLDTGFLGRDEFLEQVHDLTGTYPKLVEKMLDNDFAKNLPLLDYIKGLKLKDYKIGMISNISSNWIRDSFLTPEEQDLFDDMVLSFEVRLAKPDPHIYQLACERLGVEVREAIMVDDVAGYGQAAQSLGMGAIVYSGFSDFKKELEDLLSDSDQ